MHLIRSDKFAVRKKAALPSVCFLTVVLTNKILIQDNLLKVKVKVSV